MVYIDMTQKGLLSSIQIFTLVYNIVFEIVFRTGVSNDTPKCQTDPSIFIFFLSSSPFVLYIIDVFAVISTI